MYQMLLKTRELDYNICFSMSHFTQFHLIILSLKAALHKVSSPSQKQRCWSRRGKSQVQKSSSDTWHMAQGKAVVSEAHIFQAGAPVTRGSNVHNTSSEFSLNRLTTSCLTQKKYDSFTLMNL